jgi:membrane-associated phospholipid phosphatase
MQKTICILLIFLTLFSTVQAEEKQKPPGPKPSQVPRELSTAENELEEFISPPYTCLFCKTFLQTFLHDTKHVLIFPTYYDRKKWLIFGGALGSILTISAFDDEIQKEIQSRRNSVTDKAADIINPFGFEAAYALMAGLYLHGVFFHNPKSKVVALDAISSTLISWGLISTLFKIGTGRSRPFLHEGQYHFDPLTRDGDENSFPSGHTTQAFSLAAVLTKHYHNKAVFFTTYGLASLVALSRMNNDKHWTSDVVGGALLGTFIGRELVVYNRRKRYELSTKAQVTFAPLISNRGKGLNVIIDF